MNIGVVVNKKKDKNMTYTKKLLQILDNKKINSRIIENSKDSDDLDIIMSVGGDGTFLKSAKIGAICDKPVVGINLGTLGFLTEIEKDKIEHYIDRIIINDFTIHKRSMLDVSMINNNHIFFHDSALNDVVLSKHSSLKSIQTAYYINDLLFNTYWGDGIIISTPTGSTAYSFSAGGPIVDPDTSLVLLTPICAHSPYARSYITTIENTIKIKLNLESEELGIISVDGMEPYYVRSSDTILVKKSELASKFIIFSQNNKFDKIINQR